MSLQKVFTLSIIVYLFVGCSSTPTEKTQFQSYCDNSIYDIDLNDTITTLNHISQFYDKKCFSSTIHLGQSLLKSKRDKFYHVTSEIEEFIAPEGSQTVYVLESHERIFLSLLIANSYYHLEQFDKAKNELRRAYDESRAIIYNHGDDLSLVIYQAILWEQLKERDYAEPLWRRAQELAGKTSLLSPFIEARLNQFETSSALYDWSIYGVGRFPEVDWKMSLKESRGSYHKISAKTSFPGLCSDEETLIIPTTAWLEKLQLRNASGYHPLLNLKSWIRLPFGVGIGLATATAGVGVGVGGCYLSLAAAAAAQGTHQAGAELCVASAQLGIDIAEK